MAMDKIYFEEDGRKYKKERFTISTPRYTYVKGKFWGKFYSDKELDKELEYEEFYKFKIYEGEIEILETSKNPFKKSVISNKAIKVHPSQMPEKTMFFQNKNGEKVYYELNITEPYFQNFTFSKELQQNEGNEAFGSVTADFYGYIIDYLYEEKYKKRYALINLKKKKIEEENTDGGGGKSGDGKGNGGSKDGGTREIHPCTIMLFIAIAALLLSLIFGFAFGIVISTIFLFYVLFNCYFRFLKYLFYVLGLLLLVGFIFSLTRINWDFSPKPYIPKIVENHYKPVLRKKIFLLENKKEKPDFLMEQEFNWRSYNKEFYSGKYGIKNSDFVNAKIFKNSLSENLPYSKIIYSIKENDKNSIQQVYRMFDEIQAKRNLSKEKFAEMVISFVQNIPYTMILPGSCDAKDYNSEYIRQYLQAKNAPCSAFQKFGINTPAEFLVNLNGDCDTRTLLVFTILEHYNYDVILLSSDVYQHSIIGINLPYLGARYEFMNKSYIFWETTSFSPPGIIDNEISNTNNWYISLKSK